MLSSFEKASEVKIMFQSSFFYYCLHPRNIKILNLFDQELQLINNKPVIKKRKIKRFVR